MRKVVAGVVLALLLSVLAPQTAFPTQSPQRPPSDRATRTAWGEPNLAGVWNGAAVGAAPGKDAFNLAQLERLYAPSARAKLQQLTAKDDPASRCLPPAFPRAALMREPIQIVQSPGLVLVLTQAYHTFRVIPTDGRAHPTDMLFPTYLGDSSGKWDGDTLVVDVISFNGETWLANAGDKPAATSRGVWPTSDMLHVVERWRRVDAGRLEYQATVEDPGMLAGTWQTPKVVFTRSATDRIDVRKCFVDDPATLPPVVARS